MQSVLLGSSGKLVRTVNSSSGVAILEAPISKSGVYIIKTVNLSLGPIQVWSLATPWGAPLSKARSSDRGGRGEGTACRAPLLVKLCLRSGGSK